MGSIDDETNVFKAEEIMSDLIIIKKPHVSDANERTFGILSSGVTVTYSTRIETGEQSECTFGCVSNTRLQDQADLLHREILQQDGPLLFQRGRLILDNQLRHALRSSYEIDIRFIKIPVFHILLLLFYTLTN